MTIKAIETEYKGYRFRSRLEARWAVFFDALGIDWEYEKEGYDLGGRYYLPDFWLPEINGGCFIEIKGAEPTEAEADLCAFLAEKTGEQVFLFYGNIPEPDSFGLATFADESAYMFHPFIGDTQYRWCRCSLCGKIGIQYNGRAARICKHPEAGNDDKGYNFSDATLLDAYAAARGARFEHGEKP